MILPIIGRVRGKSFAVGAVAALAARVVLRPLLVGVVRVGYEAADAVQSAVEKAKLEAARVREEALAEHESTSDAEVRRLREEIAALKASKRAS